MLGEYQHAFRILLELRKVRSIAVGIGANGRAP